MSFLDGLLGAGASSAILGVNTTPQYSQQQIQNYNKAMKDRMQPQWVFNGKRCTLQQFADSIWPNDHEDKMLFLLTHSGPEIK